MWAIVNFGRQSLMGDKGKIYAFRSEGDADFYLESHDMRDYSSICKLPICNDMGDFVIVDLDLNGNVISEVQ